jgi:predicted permease
MPNLKLALRTLAKAPSITFIAIISLALGIGSTSAIFSIFNQMLIRPLPVEEPERLVSLAAPGPKPGEHSSNIAGNSEVTFTYPMFRDLEKSQTVFTGIAAHRSFGVNLSYHGQTMVGHGTLVSGNYFSILGLRPAIGRLIGPDDDRTVGESAVAVLAHSYWVARFNASPAVLNDTLIVNGERLTIVGVAPAGFESTVLGDPADVYVPVTMRGFTERHPEQFADRRSYWLYLFARLKPGIGIDQARSGINLPYHAILNDVEAPLQTDLSATTMAKFRSRQITVEEGSRGQSELHARLQTPLMMLLAVTGLVLLIACANIANLLLARAAGRSSEMAVRLSIGASRRQLMTQLLSESCLLAVIGGIAGLIVAKWTTDIIIFAGETDSPLKPAFRLDWHVLAFMALVTVGTGLLFGVFPAIHSTRPNLLTALKGQAGQSSGGRSASRFRSTLATVQIALSMTLLILAGLFTRSLFNIARVDLGIDIENVVSFGVSPELNGYKSSQSRALFEKLETELRAQSGVSGVTASLVEILSGDNWGNGMAVQGFETGPDTNVNASYNAVGGGYFRTMGIPLISGREFTEADGFGAPKVAIVNLEFAKKFHLGSDAVGKRMAIKAFQKNNELDIEIVGLVQNTKYSGVKEEIPPLYYFPYPQDDRIGGMTFYVRGALQPKQLMGLVQPVVSRLDPNLPVEDLRTVKETIRNTTAGDRILTVLSAAFACVATLLAAVGLYGILAYGVVQRTREFGVRMALGAEPSALRRMILKQVAWMTVIGGAAGVVVALALGRMASSLLYKMYGAADPEVLVVAIILLSAVAVSAGLIPAYRAAQTDPLRALRYE